MGKKRYVIIGNGAAAIRAAETLRALDESGCITMVSREQGPAYSRCMLPAFLAGEKNEDDLRIRAGDFYEKHGIKTLFGSRAVDVDAGRRCVVLEGGSRVDYDSLLIATGSSTAFPAIKGLEGPGLFGLRDLSDARKILDVAGRGRRAVILGAGLVGLEAAVALARRGMEVTVVEKMPHLLPRQLDPAAAEILRRDLDGVGLRMIMGTGVQEAAAPESSGAGAVWDLLLDNGEHLRAEMVIAATGIRPNVDPVLGTGMRINRGITVDGRMRTSIPEIYAAGDVAETRDVITGVRMLTPTWPHASLQGMIAAWNMAGRPRLYPEPVGIQNVVQLHRVPVLALGVSNPQDASCEVIAIHRPAENLYRKLVLKDGALVGAILAGDIRMAGILAALMRRKADVSGFKDLILSGDFHCGYLARTG